MEPSRYGRFALTLLVLAVVVVSVPVHSQTFSVLYNFGTHAGDPVNPGWVNVVAQGRDGNLYSTASGGTNGLGAMFKITPGGTLTVPYSFDSTDESPHSGLTLGTDRQFYGASVNGGTSGLGTVFKITPSGTVTVLHNFAGSDGQWPWAPPIQGTDGNFYGTTFQGGTNNNGTVYKITPSGRFATLHSFDKTDGVLPYAPLVQGTDGNFYGTTNAGGPGDGGTAFKITPAGKLTVLHSFGSQNQDGLQPYGALVQGGDGKFYGTTSAGGAHNSGTVFRITAAGKYTILHSINGFENEGGNPIAGLVQATDGNLYGTTVNGTIFRISPTKPYPYTVLYNFDGTHGADPAVTLVQHTNGILYGDTLVGGTGGPCGNSSCGVFYRFNVGLEPFVSLVSTSGKVGKTIGILGQGFTGTTGVSFNGTTATFKVSSDTYLTAIVPNGATTGFVTVTTPSGMLTSNKPFRVRP